MKNLKLILGFASLVVLVAIGCKKGDAGPAGPKGPAGPDSVIYSPWTNLTSTMQVPAPGDTVYTDTVVAPSINQAALDHSVIVSYLNLANDPTTSVVLVPLAAVSFAVTESFSVGIVDLASSVDLTGIPYRYVIVPGTIQGNKFISGPAAGLSVSDVKSMSYANILKLGGKDITTSTNN
ncbi:MAG: hypothetical protein JST75_01660 [Bacteroidetes bacterium]|nr:hypothetical protein [Bacteroidota bacterium]